MAKIVTPTTGYINNGGLVQLGSDNTSDQWDYLSFSKASNPWRISVEGDLPTNGTDQNMTVSFFEGTIPLFSAYGTWGVQGQSSQGATKKNWKLKLKNPGTGNKLKIKIGDWFPMSSVTLKAYADDRTLIRDSLTTEIWRNFHKAPSGFLAPQSAYKYFDGDDFGVHTSALFSTAGFPCELWHNGEFLGLYVLRSNNSEDDYLMDTNNPQHILIQPQHASNFWTSGNYNPGEWEYTSPATTDDTTTQACQRIIKWFSDCLSKTVSVRDTYFQYVDLTSVFDYIFICEISASFDSMENNFMLGSWNATPTSGVWSFWPYDEDETFGLIYGATGPSTAADQIGWVMQRTGTWFGGQDPAFFDLVHNEFRPELRARWKYLRDNDFISPSTINRMIKAQTDLIDPTMMAQDVVLWPKNIATGSPSNIADGGKWSVSYVSDYAKGRIEWLDQQWGYA